RRGPRQPAHDGGAGEGVGPRAGGAVDAALSRQLAAVEPEHSTPHLNAQGPPGHRETDRVGAVLAPPRARPASLEGPARILDSALDRERPVRAPREVPVAGQPETPDVEPGGARVPVEASARPSPAPGDGEVARAV